MQAYRSLRYEAAMLMGTAVFTPGDSAARVYRGHLSQPRMKVRSREPALAAFYICRNMCWHMKKGPHLTDLYACKQRRTLMKPKIIYSNLIKKYVTSNPHHTKACRHKCQRGVLVL